jgi:hypothetical protein
MLLMRVIIHKNSKSELEKRKVQRLGDGLGVREVLITSTSNFVEKIF